MQIIYIMGMFTLSRGTTYNSFSGQLLFFLNVFFGFGVAMSDLVNDVTLQEMCCGFFLSREI